MTALPLQEGLAAPARIVENYLQVEREGEDALLDDVQQIIPTIKTDIPLDPPMVWIQEHPTISEPGKDANLSKTQYMMTPFEFICIELDDDPIVASSKARNLATRVGASIFKNFNRVKSDPDDPDRMFQFVRFGTFLPDGTVEIEEKRDGIPATSIIFEFVYPIQWVYCKRL
jgi:hypothetical protein